MVPCLLGVAQAGARKGYAPGPGVVVQVGDTVSIGDPLVVLESMKMEVPVPSLENARVLHVFAKEGQTIAAGEPLVVLGPNSTGETDSSRADR